MASTLSRSALRSLARPCMKRAVLTRRAIHLTPVAQKRKSKVVVDDLFGEESQEDGDLFSEQPGSQSSKTPLSTATAEAGQDTVRTSKLSPEARLAQFTKTLDFVKPRIGRHPTEKFPLVRKGTWPYLVQLASSQEQLEQVLEQVPEWNESAGVLDTSFSETLTRRCEELSCPTLALEVFGNISKYGLSLSLPAARQLLHSLHMEAPIQDTVTAVSLFQVHGLPAAYEDLTSCAMVAAACYKAGTPESLELAKKLVPKLQALVEKTPSLTLDTEKSRSLQKPTIWTTWALKKVQSGLVKEGKTNVDWLNIWKVAMPPSA